VYSLLNLQEHLSLSLQVHALLNIQVLNAVRCLNLALRMFTNWISSAACLEITTYSSSCTGRPFNQKYLQAGQRTARVVTERFLVKCWSQADTHAAEIHQAAGTGKPSFVIAETFWSVLEYLKGMALCSSKLHYTVTSFFTKFLQFSEVTHTAAAVLESLALARPVLGNEQ